MFLGKEKHELIPVERCDSAFYLFCNGFRSHICKAMGVFWSWEREWERLGEGERDRENVNAYNNFKVSFSFGNAFHLPSLPRPLFPYLVP